MMSDAKQKNKKNKFEVKQSAIHGKGLFATATIAPGEYIGIYQGKITHEIDTYVLWMTDEQDQEYGIDGENELRYVNHHTDPNAAFYDAELYAERQITAGQEITHHYGQAFDDECNQSNA